MGEILKFPRRSASCECRERHLTSRECLLLGQLDHFGSLIEVLDDWLALHPQSCSRRNLALISLLTDTWLVYHIAANCMGALPLNESQRLRWSQLGFVELSDIELLFIVVDNLIALRQGVAKLRHDHPPRERGDLRLFGLEHSLSRLLQQLENLLNAPYDDRRSRHPEFDR